MDFTEFLTNNPVVLDGAMSTPLEKLGADTNNDLWTAKALIDNEELVYEVHKMYFEAGADLIITDTYQANELSVEEYQQFHLPRIEELVNAEVDILAIETQPKLDEVLAILELLKEKYPQQKVYVSYTLSDDDTISDGTPLPRAIHALEDYSQVIAVGINCVKLELVEPALKNMKEITDKHLIVYPS